jgi:Concanavalin A-like lectin/glucanases superfamily
VAATLSAGNNYTHGTLLTLNAAWSACAWIYPTTLTGTYHSLLTSDVSIGLQLHLVGGNWRVGVGTQLNDFDGATLAAVINTWYWVGLSNVGTSGKTAYSRTAAGVFATEGSGTDGIGPATRLNIGNWDNAAPVDQFIGRMAAVKVWRRALTADEMRTESLQQVAASIANLQAFYPFIAGASAADWHTQGMTLTTNGTPGSAEGPPVPWARHGRRRSFVAMGVAGGTAYFVTPSGAMTPTGALIRQANVVKAGAVTSAGTVARQPAKSPTGILTGSGALAKRVDKPVTGGVNSGGVVATMKVVLRAYAGTLTSSGAVVRQPSKGIGAALTMAGALVRVTSALRSGTATLAGAVAKAMSRPLAGTVASSGTVERLRASVRTYTGALMSSGALARQAQRAIIGAISSSGGLARLTQRRVAGTLTPQGAILRGLARAWAGLLTVAGSIVTALAGQGQPVYIDLIGESSNTIELVGASSTDIALTGESSLNIDVIGRF